MTIADDLVTLIDTYYGDVGGGVKPEHIINLARYKTDPPVPKSKEYIAVWIPPVTAEKELINEFYADVDNILLVRIATGDSIERMEEIANEVRIIINNNAVTGVSLQYTKNEADVTMRYDNLFVYEFQAILENNAIPIDAAYDGWEFTPHEHNDNGFENRTDSDISFVSGTRTFTIAPAVTSFIFWQDRTKYTKTASEDLVISDVAGIHMIYYDSGILTEAVNPSHTTMDSLILDKVLVALIYWNTTDDDDIVFGDERHGYLMSGATHHYLHDVFGAQYESGFGLSGYTLNTASDAALNFEVTDGLIYDEDLELEIVDGSAANQYEQQLSDGDAEVPVMYRDDVTGAWTEEAASTLPYLTAGSGRLAYNLDDEDGTFSQVEISNNKFMTYTMVATNDMEYPIKMIQGQEEYNTKNAALEDGPNEILAFGDFPTPEMDILYRFIMQTNDGFGGTKKAKIIDITDFRGNPITGSAATATDHGSLGGLADDDHDQYLLVDGSRDGTGNQLFGGDVTVKGGDADDYHIFTTNSDIPEMKIIGGGMNKITSDDATWVRTQWHDAVNDFLEIGYVKSSNNARIYTIDLLTIKGGTDIRITPSNDDDDYWYFKTSANVASILPVEDKAHNVGSPSLSADHMYADDFDNTSPFEKFDNPLEELKKVKDKDGKLDYASLPDFVRSHSRNPSKHIWGKKMAINVETGKEEEQDYIIERAPKDVIEPEGWSINRMVVLLYQALQEATARIEALEATE